MNTNQKYIAYNSGGMTRKGTHPDRTWQVIEENGTEDGRLVAGDMIERDAKLVTRLLNDAPETP